MKKLMIGVTFLLFLSKNPIKSSQIGVFYIENNSYCNKYENLKTEVVYVSEEGEKKRAIIPMDSKIIYLKIKPNTEIQVSALFIFLPIRVCGVEGQVFDPEIQKIITKKFTPNSNSWISFIKISNRIDKLGLIISQL